MDISRADAREFLVPCDQDNLKDSWQNGKGTTLHHNKRPDPEISTACVFNPYYTGQPRHSPESKPKSSNLDRQKIIERIKNGGSKPATPEPECLGKRKSNIHGSGDFLGHDGQNDDGFAADSHNHLAIMGQQIERPRSALHRGDFREKSNSDISNVGYDRPRQQLPYSPLSTSPVAPWHPEFPTSLWQSTRATPTRPGIHASERNNTHNRPRAYTHISNVNSFVYKAPTSPLAQSSRPDTPESGVKRASRSPDRSRRHTFSPPALNHFHTVLGLSSPEVHVLDHRHARYQMERSLPYQAHQPRRSINLTSISPQAPSTARRTSLSESPLQHAHMVGSYEESILRGRMSTTPSRPLNFMAQIGVLGRGMCKAALKCPPHAIVPFPAVFYSYNSGAKAAAVNDQPSPYVGLIDLENNLPMAASRTEKRQQRLHSDIVKIESDRNCACVREDDTSLTAHSKQRRQQRAGRRSRSPKAPPGGSYRIPAEGQIQIIIKNPNKTAVKLFLVPYDVTDMAPGQKTFIRQRSYSAGPLLETTESISTNINVEYAESFKSSMNTHQDRPVLRYLIHLHICCPSKDRYYLYKSIRVVFANRVPDGKEKLRNEIQFPEPRYSVYKLCKEPGMTNSTEGPRASIRAEGETCDLPQFNERFEMARSSPFPAHGVRGDDGMVSVLPRQVLPTLESRPGSREVDNDECESKLLSTATLSSFNDNGTSNTSISAKLNRPGESFQFERDTSRMQVTGPQNKSLLSKRLQDLAFRAQIHRSDEVDY